MAHGDWLHRTLEISMKIRRRCRRTSQHAQQPDGIFAKRELHAAAPPIPDTAGRGRHSAAAKRGPGVGPPNSEAENDGSGAHFVKTPAVARPYRGCTPYTLN